MRLPLVISLLAACTPSGPGSTGPTVVRPPPMTAPVPSAAIATLADHVRELRKAGDDAHADEALRDLEAKAGHAIAYVLPEGIAETTHGLLVSPDGARWAAPMSDLVSIRDSASGLEVASIPVHTLGAGVALLDGDRLAIADAQGIRVLDATGAVTGTVRPGGALGLAIAAGPGDTLVLADAKEVSVVTLAGAVLYTVARPANAPPPTWIGWRESTCVVVDEAQTSIYRLTRADHGLVAQRPHATAVGIAFDGRRIALHEEPDTIPPQGPRIVVLDGVGNQTAELKDDMPYDDVVELGFAGDTVVAHRRSGAVAVQTEAGLAAVPSLRSPRGWGVLPKAVIAAGRRLEMSGHDLVGGPDVAPGYGTDALAWSRDGKRLFAFAGGSVFVASRSGTVGTTMYSALDPGARVGVTASQPELWYATSSGYSPDDGGEMLAWDSTLKNATTFANAAVPRGNSLVAAATQDGARYVEQGAVGDPIHIRDAQTSRLVNTIAIRDPFDLSNPMPVERVAFANRDAWLVAGGHGHTVVWDIARRAAVWTATEGFLAVSADGRTIVTRTATGLRATDTASGKQLAAIDLPLGVFVERSPSNYGVPDERPERASEAAAVAFSPDGKQLAIGTRRGELVLVDTATWKPQARRAFATEVGALAWRPDGKVLAASSRGGVTSLWRSDGTHVAAVAFGTTHQRTVGEEVVPDEPGAPVDPAADWVAVFDDGTNLGPGRRHLGARAGDVPLGVGLATPAVSSAAPTAAWEALFE